MKLKYGPYSSSRLDTATCGYAFERMYVRPIPYVKDNVASSRGSVVHEVLEKVTQCMLSGKYSFSNDEIRPWISAAINKYPEAYQEIDDVYAMVKKYIERPPKFNGTVRTELNVAVEHSGTYYLDTKTFPGETRDRPFLDDIGYDHPNAAIRGRIDILMLSEDGLTATIIDHKTQPNIEDADTIQLGIYALLAKKTYPAVKEVHTVLHFARYGSYSDAYVWTERDLANVEEQIFNRIDYIENQLSFEPVVHKGCTYCPFKFECLMKLGLFVQTEMGDFKLLDNHLKILGDTNKAVRYAGFLYLMDCVRDVLMKELKAHVDLYGPIAIPKVIYERRATEEKDFDKLNKSPELRQKAFQIFKKYGFDPTLFMIWNKTSTESIWKTESEALVKEFWDIVPTKIRTMFKDYKL